MAPCLRGQPNVMFSFGEGFRHRAFLEIEVERLRLASLCFDVADRRFCYATDEQGDTVGAGLQRWVTVMADGICMNLANFTRIFALYADLRALDRLAGGILDDAAERGLSLRMGFQHQAE